MTSNGFRFSRRTSAIRRENDFFSNIDYDSETANQDHTYGNVIARKIAQYHYKMYIQRVAI